MAFEVTGLVVDKLKQESGVSKAGKEWTKQDFVIETEEAQFPKKIAFSLFGDKTDLISRIDNGERVKVKFSVESREFGGKWYSNVNAFSVDIVLDEARGESSVSAMAQNNTSESNKPEDDGLPF